MRQIKIIKSCKAVADEYGATTRSYSVGEVISLDQTWKISMAERMIQTHNAEYIQAESGAPEVKSITTSTEEKPKRGRPRGKKPAKNDGE